MTKTSCVIEGCKTRTTGRSLCSKHYSDYRRRKQGSAKSPDPNFWWVCDHANWEDDNECLIYPKFNEGSTAFPTITLDGEKMVATRYMCFLKHGPSPTPEHQAAHSCGKAHLGCINPNHLRWATRKENEADKIIHGTLHVGEARPNAVLNEDKVRLIRDLYTHMPAAHIAKHLGVKYMTIVAVVKGRTWRHVA